MHKARERKRDTYIDTYTRSLFPCCVLRLVARHRSNACLNLLPLRFATMESNKKRRLAPLAGSSLSISSLATILGQLSKDPGAADTKCATPEAQAISKEVRACVAIRTPFGKLIQEFDLHDEYLLS